MSEAYLHTCIKDDGGTPARRCYACEEEKAAAGLKLSPDDVLDLYVPGRLRCPTCKFKLTKATLFVQSGQVGASKAEVYQQSEPCPNDGEPMVRVTWREEADANREYAERLINEIIDAVGARSLPEAMEAIKRRARAEALASKAQPDAGLDAAWESFAEERSGMLSASPLGFARQAFYAGAQATFSALVEAINEPEEDDSIRRMEALANEIGSACEELKL